MPFFMNEDREAVVEVAREFAQKECAPLVREIEETDRFPLELFRRAGELGLVGLTIPEELGGSGMDLTTLCLVAEEISKVLPALGQIMMSHTGQGDDDEMVAGSGAGARYRCMLPDRALREFRHVRLENHCCQRRRRVGH